MLKIIFRLILSMFTRTKKAPNSYNTKNSNNMEDKNIDGKNIPPETIYPMW